MDEDGPTMDSLIRAYAKAESEHEKADIENRIRTSSVPKMRPRDLTKIVGGTAYEHEVRAQILASGIDQAWSLIDQEGLSMRATLTVIRRGQKIAKAGSVPADEAFRQAFEWMKRHCHRRHSKHGVCFVRKNGAKTKDAWKSVTSAIHDLVNAELKRAGPTLKGKILADFKTDLNSLIQCYRIEIKTARRIEKEIRSLTSEAVKEACEFLDIKLPRDPSDLDMAQVKARYKKLAKEYHPDRNPGNEHVAGLYIKAGKAYGTLIAEHERARK